MTQLTLAYGGFLHAAGEARSAEASEMLGQAQQLARQFDFGRARARLNALGWK